MNTHLFSLPSVPEELTELIPLALDLRWSWSHVSDELWESLDPELWRRTGNPWLILHSLSPAKLQTLAQDQAFCTKLKELATERRAYLEKPTWFEEVRGHAPLGGIAYFSMEYGLTEALPLYSGGLGMLAGDFLKACSDLGIPAVGVGLLYQGGYFHQIIDQSGQQVELYPNNNPWELPITPVRNGEGQLLRLHYHFNGSDLWVRAWQAQVGRTTLYLLDLNDPANHPSDRCITDRLYGGGTEQRLQQEMLLGIVGWQLLETLGIEPTICHLNEGHAALAILERARSYMQRHRVDFELALTVTRAGNLFTTHTPVAAGFDRFAPNIVRRYLGFYCELLGISVEELLALGRLDPNDPDEPFNMPYLAIRGSGAINAVSRLHGQVSRRIFAPLFPHWPQAEVPIGHVTNGVHTPSWDSPASDRLWTEACGRERWLCDPCLPGERLRQLPAEELWELRAQNRRRLVEFVRAYYRQRPTAFSYLPPVGSALLDPNVLTLGFARRFTAYKRPNLMLADPERLVKVLSDAQRPMQLILAGKAHPLDEEGKRQLHAWIDFIRSHPQIAGKVVFLPDYDMQMAELLVSGVDVWINTPRRPWEACGTSGMKVLVNGGLNLSELDGWWAEAYDPSVGWAIGDGQEHAEPDWDRSEAQQLYDLLEREIAPAFYARDARGIPVQWVAKMRESMAKLAPFFSANRMVRQYVEQYYLPMAESLACRNQDSQARAKQILDWRRNLETHWQTVHIGEVKATTQDNVHRFEVPVYLGAVAPEGVQVELYADPLAPDQLPERIALTPQHPLFGAEGGFLYAGEILAARPIHHYTVRVVPHHKEAHAPLEIAKIVWQKS